MLLTDAINRYEGMLEIFNVMRSCYPEFDLQGKRVLDVGCGTGNGLLASAKMGAKESIGVDIDLDDYGDTHFEDIAKQFTIDISNIKFIEDDITKPSKLGEEKFDVIFSYDVWEHISKPELALKTCAKLLNKNGLLLISCAPLYYSPIGHHLWNFYPQNEFPWAHLTKTEQQLKEDGKVDDWGWAHYITLNKMTLGQFQDAAEANGLVLVFEAYDRVPHSEALTKHALNILPEKIKGITQEDLYLQRMLVVLKRKEDINKVEMETRKIQSKINYRYRAVLKRVKNKARHLTRAFRPLDPARLSNDEYIALGFQMILNRAPSAEDLQHHLKQLNSGKVTRHDFLHLLFTSKEYHCIRVNPLEFMHRVRLWMYQNMLPPAEVIIDLGGASPGWQEGALFGMGYPHHAKKLMIVDLPPDVRMLKSTEKNKIITDNPKCDRIEYVYSSMTDLSFASNDSIDLVWSGESIEHVTEKDADICLKEIFRVLKPGGYFCLDTPNRNITKLTAGKKFVHPEHKIEYQPQQLMDKLKNIGFEILEIKGLIPMPASRQQGVFYHEEMEKNPVVSDDYESSYMFFIKARKPLM